MRKLILSYTIQEVIPNVYTKFTLKILGAVVPEKCLMKDFIGEKEKWTNKGKEVAIDNRLSVAISLLTTGKIFKN